MIQCYKRKSAIAAVVLLVAIAVVVALPAKYLSEDWVFGPPLALVWFAAYWLAIWGYIKAKGGRGLGSSRAF